MPSKNHTHFYGRKSIYNIHMVWACHLPDCSHYQPIGTSSEILEGKNSICWQCAKEFRLTKISLENDKPCCSEKCQNEYNMVIMLAQQEEKAKEEESSDMCPKCKIRLKHGTLNWCWQCTMS